MAQEIVTTRKSLADVRHVQRDVVERPGFPRCAAGLVDFKRDAVSRKEAYGRTLVRGAVGCCKAEPLVKRDRPIHVGRRNPDVLKATNIVFHHRLTGARR